MILAKDFIETTDGLIFAVVESGLEQGKVLCFLRYILSTSQWKKASTEQAKQFLAEHHPQYLHYSEIKQAHCHALTLDDIVKHHQPKKRLQQLLAADNMDSVESDCISLCALLQQYGLDLDSVGITGSILISAQKQTSDIDLVFYSLDCFNQARKITQQLITQGQCFELSEPDWQDSYDRRSCELSYDEYVWHEKRKFNKAMINQRKFDLSLVNTVEQNNPLIAYKKIKAIVVKVQVIDDTLSFDYPAEFAVKHPQISSAVSYTATYTGQAKAGEWIEVSGMLEQSSIGNKRIIVGSSREAQGEYIKVVRN